MGDRKGRPNGKRLPLSGEPLGVRIATASVRTGFAMTGGLQGVRWLVGGGTHGSRPTEAYLVVRRGGALPLPRATARVAPTEGYKRCGGVKNPPVTASPCQPPLGKGAEGTGDADCHTSDIGHWFAMTGFCKECGGWWAAGHMGPALRGLMVKKRAG